MESDQLLFWYIYSMATFGLFGAAIARRWNRNAFTWGILSALLTLPAIAALCLVGKARTLGGTASAEAWRYWLALKLVDPDAAMAGEHAHSLDKEGALAELMFELRDPTRLQLAVAAVTGNTRPGKTGWTSAHG